ncbi:Transcription factor gte6 [Thalictrum thalictroides]|uniref:Transcription factor gte6 n=1 Tax=Thalictrum thalictroides TaxID=46969 RepID=A0A7J6VC60_THATH|nr:Transcription factor gte6 [Thalictrum thalictroides]
MKSTIQDKTHAIGNYMVIDKVMESVKTTEEASDVERLKHQVDEIIVKVDELEQKVNDVDRFYTSLSKKQPNSSKGSSAVKERQQFFSIKKLQQEASKREAAAAKRMQELIRHFGTIFRQITTNKWAYPFLNPVDVEGLGLHDYYEIIDKPMDFSTITNQMEAKDGTGYKNVREICADVRLVFKNAMTYNDERNDVHIMAKSLLEKFEAKWLQFLPKITEEETRRKEEAEESRLGMQLAQEAANAKMSRHINNELSELDMHLDKLRETVIQKCRKMSVEEKRKLGLGLSRLSPEDLTKALEIIAKKNPNFQAAAEEVDIDMDVQSESTLWRLKFFVNEALEAKGKEAANKVPNENNKRKREICDALAKNAKKRSKKM